MLSFSSIPLYTHKIYEFILNTYTLPPQEMFIDNGDGTIDRDPVALPVIGYLLTQEVDWNSCRVDWDVFMPPLSVTHTELKIYEYAENDPYNLNLLRFSKSLIVPTELRLHVFATGLDENTNYRVRVRAVSEVGTQTLTGEWVESLFTTLTIPLDFTGTYRGFYYINGVKTSLDYAGNGIWNNAYYINGLQTTVEYIDCLGSWVGYLYGRFTVNFERFNGEFNCGCCTQTQKQTYEGNYVDGMLRPLNWPGYGFTQTYAPISPWFSKAYGYNSSLLTYSVVTAYYTTFIPFTGYTNGKFYVSGVESPFDSSGVGSISVGGTTYNFLNGAPISGSKNGKYYVGGVETSLSSDGTGTWNGKIYNKGSFVSLVNIAYTWQQGEIDGNEYNYSSSFGSGITYG